MNINDHIKVILNLVVLLFFLTALALSAVVYLKVDPLLTAFKSEDSLKKGFTSFAEGSDEIKDGIHLRSGLVEGKGLMQVINNCTNCHSAKLISQNRMNKERWLETIRWMQKTQNLWDLGENETIIVNYLASNYAPEKTGRRKTLPNIEWYELETP